MFVKRKKPRHDHNERDALSEIINFIAQEAYKLAVIKQFPDDFSRICTLCRKVERKLNLLYGNGYDSMLQYLTREVVNHIVLRKEKVLFEECVVDILSKEYFLSNDLRLEVPKEILELYDVHADFQCCIPHKYEPFILGTKFDYYEALEYFYGLAFNPERKGNTTIFTQAPYFSIRPYADRIVDRVQCETKEIDVPDTALSKNKGVGRVIYQGPDVIESWMELGMLPVVSAVDYTTQLHFHVNLSAPITNADLDRIIARLRGDISSVQRNNRDAKIQLAETETELIAAYRTPNLETVDYLTMAEMHKASLPNLKSAENAKDYLCGLILLDEHWVKVKELDDSVSVFWKTNTDGVSILKRRGHLSLKLGNIHREGGFSPAMIERGSKALSKIIHRYTADFQEGRVQFNVRLNTLQRKILNTQESVRLERLHINDRSKVEKEIIYNRNRGRHTSVKARRNGSYVLCW
jgi:hypothetical protein